MPVTSDDKPEDLEEANPFSFKEFLKTKNLSLSKDNTNNSRIYPKVNSWRLTLPPGGDMSGKQGCCHCGGEAQWVNNCLAAEINKMASLFLPCGTQV